MIINITLQDIWEEFVYFRKNGHHDTAFSIIRRTNTMAFTKDIIACVAHHKYNPRIGDIIMLEGSNIGTVWSKYFNNEYSEITRMTSRVSNSGVANA